MGIIVGIFHKEDLDRYFHYAFIILMGTRLKPASTGPTVEQPPQTGQSRPVCEHKSSLRVYIPSVYPVPPLRRSGSQPEAASCFHFHECGAVLQARPFWAVSDPAAPPVACLLHRDPCRCR